MMQLQQAHKGQNAWAMASEALLQWLALLLHTLIQLAHRVPTLRQFCGFVGLLNQKPVVSHPLRHQALLPPCVDYGTNKLTVILDLDETLVCAYESSGLPPPIHNKALRAGLKWFRLECTAVDKEGEGKSRVNHVMVYERPGLQEFLTKASEFAELVLFTAGLEGYASPLVDKIDPKGKISARLYRSATVATRYREHVKDLSCLGRDLCRTVIVDNNPFSFVLQPYNGIPCVPFTGDNPEDRQLLGVVLPLLQHLSLQEDIRPVLFERFQMPAWFRRRGIPTPDWPYESL